MRQPANLDGTIYLTFETLYFERCLIEILLQITKRNHVYKSQFKIENPSEKPL